MNDSQPTPAEEVLVQYRPWLRFMARVQVESQFQGKFDPSDIVQQTVVEALNADDDFRGRSEGERINWLRVILARVVAREARRYRGTQKRDVHREVSIEQSLAHTSMALGAVLAGNVETPSVVADQREQQLIVAEALESLPDDQRDVVMLRSFQSMSHEEVAERMNRSVSAVRMLWLRALKRLRAEVLARQ